MRQSGATEFVRHGGRHELRRGRGVHEAHWTETNGEPEVLVSIEDPIAFLITQLEHERPSDRYRAIQGLAEVDDRSVNEALLALLEREPETTNRAEAASILAKLGEERASDLLLPDLRKPAIPDAILDAIGRIGNLRAAAELEEALDRVKLRRTRGRVRRARAEILERYGYDEDDRRRR